jgi:PAS domain S-box-containing protein
MSRNASSKTAKKIPIKGIRPARKQGAAGVKNARSVRTRSVVRRKQPVEIQPEAAAPPPDKALRVLIVEDLEDDALLMVRELTRNGYRIDFLRVDTSDSMTAALRSRPWDIVLSDHSMPRFNAPAALSVLKQHGLDLPFIIVSGSIGEDQAVAVMKAGASDYLRKDNLVRLTPVVEREIRESKIRKARVAAEEALRQSEALYRTLVNTSPDAIIVTDLDTRIRMVNPRAARIMGWEESEDRRGQRWLDAFPLPQAPLIRQSVSVVRNNGRVEIPELEISRRNGSAVQAELSGALLLGGDGRPDAILFVLHDITARKNAEEQIRRQLDRLAALRTIDAAITASLDLRVTLMVILDAITSQLGADAADFFLLHPHSQTLYYAAGRGFRSANQKDVYLQLGRGYAGRAALERRILSIPKLAEGNVDPSRSSIFQSEGFISYFGAPLLSKGQVKGVLEVFHRTPMEPDPEWLTYLETIAEQAAIAIDNAALFEDLQRSNVELTLAYDATMEGWSHALDLRDRETEGHTRRVTEATLRLARVIGIPETELVHVRRGCLLHDIGKMAIPDGILLKPGPLSAEEWVNMRQHPTFAFELLSPISFLRPTLDIPYCHHEKYDGSGYPRGLKEEQIPLSARIFSVVDVWDALRSDRPYRPAWSEEKVRAHMTSLAGSHFDPAVLQAFMDIYFPPAGDGLPLNDLHRKDLLPEGAQ